MSVYLDTTGNSSLAIAVCDRCNAKFPIGELQPDPNAPGLRVCAADRDLFDPHRLAPRKPDNITLRHPRPDVSLVQNPAGAIAEDGNSFVTLEDGTTYLEF